MLEIIIKGEPKEIADLELALKDGGKNVVITQTINMGPSDRREADYPQQ